MFTTLFYVTVAIVMFGVLSLAQMFIKTRDLRLWPAIRRGRAEIKKIVKLRVNDADVLSFAGATAINPGHLSFLIKTKTDKERDALREDPKIYQQFRSALKKAGYPETTNPVVHIGIESQETVDRDYGGSWRELIGYP